LKSYQKLSTRKILPMTEQGDRECSIGDYVEIVTGDFIHGSQIMHGIVLAIAEQPALWTSYHVFVVELNKKMWYYSYELTTISSCALDNYLTKKALT